MAFCGVVESSDRVCPDSGIRPAGNVATTITTTMCRRENLGESSDTS
jgi:hypothetical protein